MNKNKIPSPKPWARNVKILLNILSDGKYHSGTDLGKKLNLTRNAIWKIIKQLKKLGIEIKAKTNLGYIIPEGLDLLSKKNIIRHIKHHQNLPTSNIFIFDEVNSTNDYLYQFIKSNDSQQRRDSKYEEYNAIGRRKLHAQTKAYGYLKNLDFNTPYICLAESQSNGKGRLGRTWHSPFAQNIYLSLSYQFYREPHELSSLGLVAAITIVEALKKCGVKEKLSLKWPNDVLWDGKKLAGVLVELFGETNHIYNAIIGIGLNIKMSREITDKKIDQPWCDLLTITKTIPNRNKIAGLLIDQILTSISTYQEKGLKSFIKKWLKLDATYNKKVVLYTPSKKISGIGRGINENGYFLLKDNRGKIRSFATGEIALRLK